MPVNKKLTPCSVQSCFYSRAMMCRRICKWSTLSFLNSLHFLISKFSFKTRASTTTTSTLQALQLPPSTHPACTHSALRWGLMSNKHWVTTVLESSQLSQMPNWSLEVLHNAKQHSLKLGVKKKKNTRSYKMQKCTKMHSRRSSVAVSKWCRWIINSQVSISRRIYKM